MTIDIDHQLRVLENNYILGLAAVALFSTDKIFPILEDSHATFGQYSIQFSQVVNLLHDTTKRNGMEKEFILMLLRGLIKETFEIIKAKSKSAEKVKEFKSQKWYHFSRLIRNCISHNFLFNFKKDDLALLPVQWKHCIIDISMNGKPISLKLFGYVEAWELFIEMRQFAQTL